MKQKLTHSIFDFSEVILRPRYGLQNYFEILNPLAKIGILKFWLLRGHWGQISDPWKVITQNWYYFWNLWPYKPVCRYQWRKKLNFEILTSLSLLRSDKWLLGDHNPKPMLFSKSLTQKSLSRDTHEAKNKIWNSDLSEVK